MSGAGSDTTLVEVLCRRAAEHPGRTAYRFLTDGEREGAALTYGELDRQARALAAWLRERGLAGERALLLYPPGLEFVAAFLGCLYAGVIAVPAYPPRANRPDGRLRAIAEDARPRLALTTPALQARAAALTAHNPFLAQVEWLATAGLDVAGLAPRWREEFRPAAGDLAFLQYTSGSTATPKGVAVHHRNLVHNQRLIERAFAQSESSVIVGWLPLYHDMGLIGNVLQPLWLGATCVLMSPVSFLQRPARWLEAISRYRATTSGGPNFAYELCAQKVGPAERQGLDLSSWTVAFNGAEPVRAETLERFAATFAACGFRREAFLPCYGLAESTLFVTGAAAGQAPEVLEVEAASLEAHRVEPARDGAAARRLVSCGVSGLGQSVAVVDAETLSPLGEGRVGEIWTAGPSVTGGYWGRPEATAEVFGARLAGDEGEWLRTGDLGFLAGEALYVTGRLKDLIILHGRNLYPQDLEATAGHAHPGLRAGGSAAFTDDEQLVVVQEVERETERGWARDPAAVATALSAIRRAVAEEHEAALSAVVLVRAGTVPKTSSGKVRRRDCRAAYLSGQLEPLSEWHQGETEEGRRPSNPVEARLERLFADLLGRTEVGIDQDLFSLGADSLQITRLLARVNETFGTDLALDELFTAPTVAELALLLDGAQPTAHADAPIQSEPGEGLSPQAGPIPLSFAQRRLWFLHQLDPGNPVHNLGAALRLSGPLDVPALAAAFTEIVRRHEALRTAFSTHRGEPEQIVRQAEPLPLGVVDLSPLPPAARETASRRAAQALARLPFDLESGHLLRVALLRLSAGEHELVLALHHIVADGGSLAVLAGELAALYGAFAARRSSPLPDLPVQYADYTLWQRRRLTEETLAPHLDYWRQRLAGELPPLELPADRPRPAVLSHRGAHYERGLGGSLSARLDGLAKERRATPFMVLAAGFAALLARYTGQSDLVLGTPVAGRDRVELEGLIGIFLNNLALRIDASGEPGLGELVGRVRETVLGAFAHAEVPFERLVDELAPGRDLSRTPLFQVLVVGQNAPLVPIELPGLLLVPREIDLGTARFDLAVSFAPGPDGWTGTWKLSTDLFDPATIARLAEHLENLLAAALAEPARPLSELALLSAAERQQLLAGWNDTYVCYAGGESCLHELIAARAARTPDAVALEFGDRGLSYGELLDHAGALAGRLAALGVGPESLVGVLAYRSLDLVVALLGTLVAGAAYVPLDPDYPAERLAYMEEDAGLAVVLVGEGLAGPGGSPSGRGSLSAEEAQSRSSVGARFARGGISLRFALPASATLALPPQEKKTAGKSFPESPAYAIYTSGSTGRPKGAVVPHRGIVNRLLWMQEAYRLVPGDRVLQKTPFSFDVSVWEFFWPLLAGSTLVVAPPGAHQDPARLAEIIDEYRVTTLHFVPSMLQVFLDHPGVESSCGSLRRVFASGEALAFELKERFLSRLPGVELHNLYGPTEASVDVTYHACRPGGRRQTVPIGRPIANTSIVLLDGKLEPVPVGVPGELHIGGMGLARGYLGRPGLTADRFVPDPHGRPGARLYKTGDLARFRPDGEVEFLGRRDHQVKIRGVRIELGEIEAALDAHPAVRESVVLARTDEPGQTRLVAYLVGLPEELSAEALRSYLAARLPQAMVPHDFVVLAALPLSPNGKVDRRALPAPAASGERPAASFAAPRTALEERLAALWGEQLGVERVGIHDGFFDLGGDSIQGALLINRLQRELGAVIYVMALFDHPTVARFAAHLEARYGEALAAAGLAGETASGTADDLPDEAHEAADREVLERYVAARFSRTAPTVPERRNPRAVFLLSPFRSGSTLLRVMLAGHPRLFAPPELELLGFDTLGERRRTFSGRDSFAREGLLRAVMELRRCDAAAAEALMAEAEARDEPVAAFYRRLQEWVGEGRLLVDKTPRYSLDRATLERAEAWFDEPLYVHLVRHPAATVRSYLEARMGEVYQIPLPPRRQAELVWRRSHENILGFLAGIPAARQHRLHFEDLVGDPSAAVSALCRFLGLPLEPAMLAPYEGERMTDGLHGAGRMMGDPKFSSHGRIEASVAGRWRDEPGADRLGAATWLLAGRLGYSRPETDRSEAEALAPLPGLAGTEPPLSFAQQRLWFLDRLSPGTSVYNMPAALRLRGRLDVPALARAAGEIERRHEVLRTVFPDQGGRPRPLVQPPRPTPLPVIDLSALPAARREAEAERRVDREIHRPFDLAAGPLWRLHLLRLAGGEHVLVVNLHHIVSDGWSIGVLSREIARLYAAFAAGRPSPLAEPPLQYADYAAWQRRRFTGPLLAEHLAYWKESLTPLPPVLEMPTDRPRPAVATYRGARLPFAVTPEVVAGLKARGRQADATLFMVLVAACQALLGRHSGQEDLALGTPVANRNRAELEGLLGVFVNTLVLRGDLSGAPDFTTLLGRARAVCLGAGRHEELPFEKLVEELSVERSLGHSPLFSVMLALQNAPPAELSLGDLEVERLPHATRTAKLELTFDLTERQDGGLAGALEHNTDLFDGSTAARLARRFTHFLGAVAAGARERLWDLPMLDDGEVRQLLAEAGDTAAPFPAEATVWDLFEATARRLPEATAVTGGGRRLSYGELLDEAGRLAGRLVRLGVGPEVPVAICAERGPAMLAGVLAVLAAGGAYLPLDPTHPAERLGYVLDDAQAPVLLTERALLPTLPPHQARVVLLDEEEGGAAGPSPAPRRALPENLAYVIYTSGSTGRPKGVEVRHRGVVNYLASMASRPGLGERDVMLALTTLSFDIAVTELFLPLAVGARIEIPGREAVADAALLAAAIEESGTTCMQATPATWTLLLDGGWAGRPGLLALCGGEALPRALADRLLPRVGALWNVYGPTETTVWSTLHPMTAGEGGVPIGRPLANTTVQLRGRHGELVPPGAAGELLIGGEGLARGYRGRPELTAERFVPDPAGEPGTRLYRTGDLVRRGAGGDLEYLGRLDHQVKIRGFRIETGEIEAVLAGHPGVAQCAVKVVGERQAERRLVAYVVRAPGALPTWEELRELARGRLPAPMVPAVALFLDRLPLTPSGKVDRRSLPDPGRDRPDLAASYVSPQNESERRVAEIWQEVLGLDRVGVSDNFFDLGGHSLLAAEVQGKLRERFGLEVPLVELFRHPTVQALARWLREQDREVPEAAPAAGRGLDAAERDAVRRRRQARARLQGVS